MQNHPNHRYIKLFTHFGTRLGERYNLFITFEDYVELCQNGEFEKRIKQHSDDNAIKWQGILMVGGKQVNAIKIFNGDGFSALITALPTRRMKVKINKSTKNKKR